MPLPAGVIPRIALFIAAGAAGMWIAMPRPDGQAWALGFVVGGLASILNLRILSLASSQIRRLDEHGRPTRMLSVGWMVVRLGVLAIVLVLAGRHPRIELLSAAAAVMLGQMLFYRATLSAARRDAVDDEEPPPPDSPPAPS